MVDPGVSTATRKVVRKVIREAAPPEGFIWAYFDQCKKYNDWEGNQRRKFEKLAIALKSDPDGSQTLQDAGAVLWGLRTSYRVQYFSQAMKKPFVTAALGHGRVRDWIAREAPSLFQAQEAEASAVWETIRQILTDLRGQKIRRDYSLVTKFLHFLFPNTVVIYDSQAAASIAVWRYFAFASEYSQAGADGEAPNADHYRYSTLADPSGSGYEYVCAFYRRFWASATEQERADLQRVSSELANTVRHSVTVTDLLDKLLWKANGNAVHLGLLD